MKNCFVLTFIVLFFYANLMAQETEKTIKLRPSFNQKILELEKNYYLDILEDSIKIGKLKFYISNIQLLKDGVVIRELEKTHFLIDLERPGTLEIPIHRANDFDRIVFCLGIDSLTSCGGAHADDLDPCFGMYWTWQSGYINVKLEGRSKACETRKNKFQFHIGGYQKPFNAIRKITIQVDKNDEVLIDLPIDAVLNQINLNEIHSVMGPSENAMKVADIISKNIRIK